MASNYVKRGFKILRQDGLVEFSKEFKQFASRRIQRMKSLFMRRYYYPIKWGGSYPDPYRLIYVDPNKIKYYLLASSSTDWSRKRTLQDEVKHLYTDLDKGGFRRRKNIGRIIDGDWDLYKKPWKENTMYRSLREVFVKNKDWEDTEFVRKRLKIIDIKGESYGYKTKDDFLEERTQYIERLYQSMNEKGYLTQKDAPNDDRNKDVFHEVSVNIGRDGEIIFNNLSGHHRLSLAKILDIDEIPVIVIARHEQWQKLRKRIYNKGFENQEKRIRDHPDLQDLLH